MIRNGISTSQPCIQMNWDPPSVDNNQNVDCWAEHSLETAIPNFTVKEGSQKEASLNHTQDTWGPVGALYKMIFFSFEKFRKRRYCLTLKWGWKMMTYISIISILTRVDPQMPRTSHAAAVERSVAGRRNAPRRPRGGLKHTNIN